jgi:hypothetical protein
VHFSFLLEGKDSQTKTETIVMSHIFAKLTPMLLFPAFCTAQPLTASEALDRYLARSRDGQSECSGLVLAVQIDASLPHLKKQGTMSGFRQVSGTGRIAYRDLQFTGDNVIKTHVIARFIANDTAPPEGKASANVTRENYSFVYEGTSDYNGLSAFVFRLQPRRKRAGFFQGELWLDANTAAPLRLWGDFVKSPSIFVRTFRFVLDYQGLHECFQPLRLILDVQTRIVGEAEATVWMRPTDSPRAATGIGEMGTKAAEPDAPARATDNSKD